MAAVSARLRTPLLLCLSLPLLLLSPSVAGARDASFRSGLTLPTAAYLKARQKADGVRSKEGTKWALLIAGSSGYWNYRHQADVCHAYQLLKKDGLKDENIVVFMYNDIAWNAENPHPGTIINRPHGPDVYQGVPMDYTDDAVSVSNFLAVLLGDASAVQGGSGKVIASGPNDHVFVFYSDHGGPGVLGMPTFPFLMADDIVDTLKTKHAKGGYRELVFYLEACEAGSIFQGLLPKDIDAYAVTAANAVESSWGTYCPGMDPPPPPEYDTCLGDLFSVAWMEDSEVHNLHSETLNRQYHVVKNRTVGDGVYGSHVMRYGNKSMDKEEVAEYLGSDPANEDAPGGAGGGALGWVAGAVAGLVEAFSVQDRGSGEAGGRGEGVGSTPRAVKQRDADMVHLKEKYLRATDPAKKAAALQQYLAVSSERDRLRLRMESFTLSLAKAAPAASLLLSRAEDDTPLVHDWQCFRKTIRAYESMCGPLTQFGLQFTPIFAAACNSSPTAQEAVILTLQKAREACGNGNHFQGPYSV